MSKDKSEGGIRAPWYGIPMDAGIEAAKTGLKIAEQSKNDKTIVSLTLKLGNSTERIYSLMPYHKTPVVYGQGYSASGNKYISDTELKKWGYQHVSDPNDINVVYRRIPVQVIVLVDGKETYKKPDKAFLYEGKTFTLEPQVLVESMAPYATSLNFESYAQDLTGARPVWLRDLGDYINSEAMFNVEYVKYFNTIGIATIKVNKDTRLPFTDYINALGFMESSNNYQAVNPYNYLGRFQFGPLALQDIGYKDKNGNWTKVANDLGIYSNQDFLNSPRVQDKAMNMFLNKNWGYLSNSGLLKYVGISMNGIIITESGLVAAAHLVGIGKLQNALKKGDLTSEEDGNGTTALSYMTKFGGYNIDPIK